MLNVVAIPLAVSLIPLPFYPVFWLARLRQPLLKVLYRIAFGFQSSIRVLPVRPVCASDPAGSRLFRIRFCHIRPGSITRALSDECRDADCSAYRMGFQNLG